MTKAEIVNEIANKTGFEKNQVQTVVEAFMTSVKGSLAKNDNVYLRGFGSFIVKERAEKTARKIPAFKPCKAFVNSIKKIKYPFKLLALCLAVKREKDIKCQRIRGKNVCVKTDIRRNSFFFLCK